jgi:hypothetical protein
MHWFQLQWKAVKVRPFEPAVKLRLFSCAPSPAPSPLELAPPPPLPASHEQDPCSYSPFAKEPFLYARKSPRRLP